MTEPISIHIPPQGIKPIEGTRSEPQARPDKTEQGASFENILQNTLEDLQTTTDKVVDTEHPGIEEMDKVMKEAKEAFQININAQWLIQQMESKQDEKP